MLGKDDDDIEAMRKIKSESAMKHIVLPFKDDFGNPYALQRGYGPSQVFAGLGVGMARIMLDHATVGDTAASWVLAAKDSLQPLAMPGDAGDSAESAVGALAVSSVPSVMQPLIEVWANRNAFGNEVYSSFGGEGGRDAPNYLSGRLYTDQVWKDMAEFGATIGVDLHPETYKHLVKSYLGPGLGELMVQTSTLLDESPHAQDKPDNAFSRSWTDVGLWRLKDSQFYSGDMFEHMTKAIKEADIIQSRGGELSAAQAYDLTFAHLIKRVNSAKSKLRRKAKKAYQNGDFMAERAYREQIKTMEIEAIKRYLKI